jgi:hydroxyethylthiazole kinase-like uncharacterized protein yjeF
MSYVLTAEQMRAVDQAATASYGVPTLLLMENAGRGIAELVVREAGGAGEAEGGLRVRIVCGAGSNGGDGFVAARHLALGGADVRVLLAAAPGKIAGNSGGDAGAALRALEALGTVAIEDGSSWGEAQAGRWREALADADVVVDALFGTGLRSDVRGVAAIAIAAMNAAPGCKIAVDIPSGIDADNGQIRGVAFRADVTGTMGARKLGFSVDAEVPAGRVEVIGLGVPVEPPASLGPFCRWLETDETLARVPRRGPSAHKGTAGHLLLVAGSAGKTGAALLAGRAAMRAGVGLCTIASTAAGQTALDAKAIELMSARYTDGPGEDAEPSSASRIAALAAGMRAVAIGPGIPNAPGMRAVVEEIAGRLALPMVIDADALNLLSADVARVTAGAPAARILTPHPGEMARLMATTVAEVQRARLSSARDLAARTRAVVVLKGARTLVALPDGTVFINPTASAALGTAGSGDVLTGLIGSLLAQGLDAASAATVGVLVHGLAGELAGAPFGGPGMLAGDLPDAIALVMARGRRLPPPRARSSSAP